MLGETLADIAAILWTVPRRYCKNARRAPSGYRSNPKTVPRIYRRNPRAALGDIVEILGLSLKVIQEILRQSLGSILKIPA